MRAFRGSSFPLPSLCRRAFALGAADAGYVQELIGRARELRPRRAPRVAQARALTCRTWSRPASTAWSTARSSSNAPRRQGPTPRAELEATLAALCLRGRRETRERQKPAVRIRRAARLARPGARLRPPAACPRRECKRFGRVARPRSTRSASRWCSPRPYLNNPSSMYGPYAAQDRRLGPETKRTRLLAYTLNFYANTKREATA